MEKAPFTSNAMYHKTFPPKVMANKLNSITKTIKTEILDIDALSRNILICHLP